MRNNQRIRARMRIRATVNAMVFPFLWRALFWSNMSVWFRLVSVLNIYHSSYWGWRYSRRGSLYIHDLDPYFWSGHFRDLISQFLAGSTDYFAHGCDFRRFLSPNRNGLIHRSHETSMDPGFAYAMHYRLSPGRGAAPCSGICISVETHRYSTAMITLILAALLAALVYMLWRKSPQAKPVNPGPLSGKVAILLLIGLLSLVAFMSPGIREKINELRRKYQS